MRAAAPPLDWLVVTGLPAHTVRGAVFERLIQSIWLPRA